MKNVVSIILLFTASLSFSQTVQKDSVNRKQKYSENSEIRVVYKDSLNMFRPQEKPIGVFVNGSFIGNNTALNVFNVTKIENMNVEKEIFEIDGKVYYGRILIKTKSNYNPKIITLKELSSKYLNLDTSPIVFQINENIINHDYSEYLVDEKFILKIELNKIKTSGMNTEINLIKLITKTSQNIKKANEIRIR